jgi:hypothetical protein
VRALLAPLLVVVCLGCGGAAGAGGVPLPKAASPSPTSAVSAGWHLTVYYTPVEAYHGPPLRAILDCRGRDLGRHSGDFLDHVQTEGFGRAAGPVQGMRYLGWDFDRGCWYAASTPLGADDRPLRAWASVAAPSAVHFRTGIRVDGCGADVDADVCARVRATAWVVDDRFSADPTDARHLDLYIGEEDRPDFEKQSPNYFELHEATVRIIG